MKLYYQNKPIRIFTINPRDMDEAQYWPRIETLIHLSGTHDLTGILAFTGNDVLVDPWLVGQTILAGSRNLSPLIAVNPIYMHPFSAAKMIASLTHIYGRKIYLNMVTGTALNYLRALDAELSHNERYDRLLEYGTLIRDLLTSAKPVSFEGRFYQVRHLQLQPRLKPELVPEFLLAGQSDAARRVTAALGGVGMQMLAPRLRIDPAVKGIHFGIVCRETEATAWAAARRLFPESEEDREMLEISMANTDSVWKKRMKMAADLGEGAEPGYWLGAFRNFKADCPYFVGDEPRTAALMADLIRQGVTHFILDVPPHEEDFEWLSHVLARTKTELNSKPPSADSD